MKYHFDTTFFYSSAELSIFPSSFSLAISVVIGPFSASCGLDGCLLLWPDPCCHCNGGQRFCRFTGGFSTWLSEERASPNPYGGGKWWNTASKLGNIQMVITEILGAKEICYQAKGYNLLQIKSCHVGLKFWICVQFYVINKIDRRNAT